MTGPGIRVTITRFVENYQPGIVECTFTDAHGAAHTFIVKVPYVTAEHLAADSTYPANGSIACRIIDGGDTLQTRRVLIIDTDEPDGVESEGGITRFEVFADQLTE